MTSRDKIAQTIRSLYAARALGDLEGTMAGFADDAAFTFNGRGTNLDTMSKPCCGLSAIKPIVKDLIGNFHFENWKEISLLIDGERASLHWKADVTCVSTGKTDQFDVCDLLTFRDGKIVEFFQTTDTALVLTIATDT